MPDTIPTSQDRPESADSAAGTPGLANGAMRCAALASDYDGTLANNGRVSDLTLRALMRFRQSGRKLILVTGRVLQDLQSVFSRFELFDCVVAENGAVLYNPATREKKMLAPPPKQALIDALTRRGVEPLGVGDAIVATWHPHETVVLDTIRKLGLELQVIFNKGAVMVLPSGVNKRSGLHAALECLELSEHNVVGIGDAENDHAFLEFCEYSVAVANAHPAIKNTADFTTSAGRGAGVAELIEVIMKNELGARIPSRRTIPIGRDGKDLSGIPSYGGSLLVAGASGSGKSTFVAGFLENLMERRYQVCVIDPEGDYEAFPGAISVGDEKHAPSPEEVLQILQKPSAHVIVNLIGIAVAGRPAFLDRVLPKLLELRARAGRPHWILVDEAHHMLAPRPAPASAELAGQLGNLALITVHPDHLAPSVLAAVETVVALGPAPDRVIETFAKLANLQPPESQGIVLDQGQLLAWLPRIGELRRLDVCFSQAERKRHKRNYARGELGEEGSFYFRGPQHKLNLRAQNLAMFLQLAEGIDDETWLHHLVRGDYSRWIRESIKDNDLAAEVAACEAEEPLSPTRSRDGIRSAIERHYTAPA